MDDLEGKPHYFRKHPFEGSPMILISKVVSTHRTGTHPEKTFTNRP